jgi:ABC-2 type transport system permease protein
VLWVALAVLLLAFAVVFMLAVRSVPLEENAAFLKYEWVRKLVSSLVGADLLETMTPTSLASFVLAHPLAWILLIAFMMTVASGVLAGEIDHGTMDLLAALPFSRRRVYASASVVVIGGGLLLCGALWGGLALGCRLTGADDVQLGALGMVACNLYAAYIFLACFAMAVSASCSRRELALAITFVPIFYSFVLNFVGPFWTPAQKVAWSGFLHYYRPLPIVRDGAWQWGDISTLLGLAVVAWGIGLVIFARRDVPAR